MTPTPTGMEPRADANASGREHVITCGFCGRAFEEDRGQPTCRSCPLSEACRFVRCPWCGYENPARPGWLERLVALLGGDGTTRRTGGDHGEP